MSDETKILCVDDNAMNRLILEEALDDYFDLRMAESGEEALELIDTFRPDVVLLDIMMPGMDGYEVCRRLRQDPRNESLVVIFCSAKAMASERVAGYEAGANDYLTKPFDEDELRAKIQVHLSGPEARTES